MMGSPAPDEREKREEKASSPRPDTILRSSLLRSTRPLPTAVAAPAPAGEPATAGKLRHLPATAGAQDGDTELVEGVAAGHDGKARILIVRLGAAADVVLALPVLHALRERFPDSEIGWLVDDSSVEILEAHPELTRLHVVPGEEWRRLGWWQRRRRMRKFMREFREALAQASYTVVMDLESTPRSARLARATKAPVRVGYAEPEGRVFSWRYLTHRISPGPELEHAVERNLSLLVPLGIPPDLNREEPRFVFPDLSVERGRIAGLVLDLQGAGAKAVVLHPGAEWPSARWPVESYTELARRITSELGMPVLVTALGGDDRPRAEAVARRAGEGARPAEVAGLRELAALVREAALFVGGETAAMHVAWTIGAPTVAVLGPTSGKGRGPLGPSSRSIDSGLGCLGCGRPRCPDATRACMRGVRPEAVFELVAGIVAPAREA